MNTRRKKYTNTYTLTERKLAQLFDISIRCALDMSMDTFPIIYFVSFFGGIQFIVLNRLKSAKTSCEIAGEQNYKLYQKT